MDDTTQEITVLKGGVSEAQRTLDRQLEGMAKIDGKAIQVLQLDTAIIGFVFTALAFLSDADEFTLGGFFNVFAMVGLLFLLGSIASTLVTYTVRRVQPGLSADSLQSLRARAKQSNAERRFYRSLLASYAEAIERNTETIDRKGIALQAALLANVYGVASLSLSVAQGLYGRVSPLVVVLVGGVLLTVTIAVDPISGLRRLRRYRTLDREA
jgi:hypothetical protein